MNIIRSIVLVILGIAVVLGVIGLFLPQDTHVERTVSVEAPAPEVYALISDLRRFNDWSPWAKLDPETQYEFSGSGVGSSMVWTSDDRSVGNGTMTITNLEPNRRVDMQLEFGEDETGETTFTLAPDGDSTSVTWAFDATFGFNPYYRYFGLLMDSMVGDQYEQGLGELKSLAEAR